MTDRATPCRPFAAAAVRSTLLGAAIGLAASVAGAQLSAVAGTPHVAAAAPRAAHGAAATPHVVTVVARDFAFELPASIPAGLTTFRLLDRGAQAHHLTIVRLDSGKTASDGLAALIKAGRGLRPAWMRLIGGPNAASAGGEATATLVLEPGSYMAFCEVPGPDPMPHFMKGMVKAFTVTGPAHPAALPPSDVALRLVDYDFVLSTPLTRGLHVIAVTNEASQAHMLVMNWTPPGQPAGEATKNFLAWANDPGGKPGPGQAVGGVTEIPPGTTVLMQRTFAPGTYLLICFSPDATDGKPHFAHGMQKEIVVR